MKGIISIAAGSDFAMALSKDGTVYTWGNSANGRLGNGAASTVWYPTRVLAGAASDDAGYFTNTQTGTTRVKTGTRINEETGKTEDVYEDQPVYEKYLTGIVEIAAGPDYALALTNNGHVLTWGANSNNSLASTYRKTTADAATPVYVVAGAMATDVPYEYYNAQQTDSKRLTQSRNLLSNIVTIEAGDVHSFAIADNGSVYAWGDNSKGQLGIEPKGKPASYSFKDYDGSYLYRYREVTETQRQHMMMSLCTARYRLAPVIFIHSSAQRNSLSTVWVQIPQILSSFLSEIPQLREML